jgi:hypothetical protein
LIALIDLPLGGEINDTDPLIDLPLGGEINDSAPLIGVGEREVRKCPIA